MTLTPFFGIIFNRESSKSNRTQCFSSKHSALHTKVSQCYISVTILSWHLKSVRVERYWISQLQQFHQRISTFCAVTLRSFCFMWIYPQNKDVSTDTRGTKYRILSHIYNLVLRYSKPNYNSNLLTWENLESCYCYKGINLYMSTIYFVHRSDILWWRESVSKVTHTTS